MYIHPAIRIYREGVFEKLSKKLKIKFFWSEDMSKDNGHIYEEVTRILKSTNIDYIQAKELHSISIDNFSLDLLRLPFQGYKVFIFSNITGTPYLMLALFVRLMRKKIILFDELWRYPKEVNKYKLMPSDILYAKKKVLNMGLRNDK